VKRPSIIVVGALVLAALAPGQTAAARRPTAPPSRVLQDHFVVGQRYTYHLHDDETEKGQATGQAPVAQEYTIDGPLTYTVSSVDAAGMATGLMRADLTIVTLNNGGAVSSMKQEPPNFPAHRVLLYPDGRIVDLTADIYPVNSVAGARDPLHAYGLQSYGPLLTRAVAADQPWTSSYSVPVTTTVGGILLDAPASPWTKLGRTVVTGYGMDGSRPVASLASTLTSHYAAEALYHGQPVAMTYVESNTIVSSFDLGYARLRSSSVKSSSAMSATVTGAGKSVAIALRTSGRETLTATP